MKTLKILAIIGILAFFTADSFGWSRSTYRHRHHWSSQSGDTRAVGAPLDGGLLAVLAAAGAGYFIARRKKKNADS